jgi:hypothetical protein
MKKKNDDQGEFFGEFDDDFNPREHARRTDPGTSHAAAHSLDNVTMVQARVLAIHKDFTGLTDERLLDEYKRRYGITAESSPRKRRHDLTRKGLIYDSGERGELKTGRKGIVWKLQYGGQSPTAVLGRHSPPPTAGQAANPLPNE